MIWMNSSKCVGYYELLEENAILLYKDADILAVDLTKI